VEFAWELKKNGYSEVTIQSYTRFLYTLMKRGANLCDSENVKEVIARQEAWSESTKFVPAASCSAFAQANRIHWRPPRYRIKHKLPFIPYEQEIDTLIAGYSRKTTTILQLLKETGVRIGEALKLEWTDTDLEKNLITLNTPEKGSKARIFKISNKLASMLNALSKKSNRAFNDKVRGSASRNFYYQRKRVARKLQNPRLRRISFHTLRH
jgi:integrase